MTWQTQPTSGGVVLATTGEDKDGKPVRITFAYDAQARLGTEVGDYVEGLGSEQAFLNVVNQKLSRDSVESTPGKSDVRKAVLAAEEEILAKNPDIEPEALVEAIGKVKSVKDAVKKHQEQIGEYLWSGTRGAGGVRVKDAVNVARELLKQDPERLKALAAELGLEGFDEE